MGGRLGPKNARLFGPRRTSPDPVAAGPCAVDLRFAVVFLTYYGPENTESTPWDQRKLRKSTQQQKNIKLVRSIFHLR